MDLNECRLKIDQIDDQLVQLFSERMTLAGDVARYKQAHQAPVLVPGREREILLRVSRAAGAEFGDYTRMLFTTIFNLSRSYQHSLTAPSAAISNEIAEALRQTPEIFPATGSVACQGTEGAYSQLAAERLFTLPDITYVRSFSGVAQAVEKGLCQYGVLPVENSSHGTVDAVYDLMREHKFYIVRSLKLHVAHALLAPAGVKLSEIREVISHEQALGQAGEYLKSLKNVKITPVENTAVAASMVAESGRRDLAAVSSRTCASLYGLAVLAENIHDNANNYTRFICISKALQIFPGANRISLMLTLPHRPGTLYDTLSRFAALGLNLLKLESRPVPGSDFEFRFYFDFAGPVYAESVRKLLDDLSRELDSFTFLGWYNEI